MDALFKGRTTSDCIERPSYIHGFDSRRRKMLVLKNGGEFVHAFAELFVCVCVCVHVLQSLLLPCGVESVLFFFRNPKQRYCSIVAYLVVLQSFRSPYRRTTNRCFLNHELLSMGKQTSKILNDKITNCDANVGPLSPYCRQFALDWSIKDVKLLHARFLKNPTGYGLVKSQFESLLGFKQGVSRADEVFNVLDEDSNGRIDALEFIAGVAQCCKGSFDEKSRFCFELVDFNVNGSLCFEELVLMMRSCVIGLLKFMGETVVPGDDEFEELADDALCSILDTLHPDEEETPALSFGQFTTWAMKNREVLNAVEKMSSRALVNSTREESDDESAEEVSTDHDTDLEEESIGVHERAMEAASRSVQIEQADQELVKALAGEHSGGDEFMAVKPWLGAVKEPTHCQKISVDVPEASLVLEWVHGFSAQQARNNLRYTSDGKIVYFAAALGVVYDRKHHKQRFYHGHDDDIISMALHPENDLIATGQIGKNPTIHVWDPTWKKSKASAEITTIATLSGFHQRGISHLAFNCTKGDKLASVGLDDDHSIAIYDWRRRLLLASGKGDKSKILACQFTPNGKTLVACGVKFVKFFSISGKALVSKRGIIGKLGKIQAFPCMGFCGNQLVLGTQDGSLYLFEGKKVKSVVSRAHGGGGKDAVTAIYWWKDGLLTGGQDGTVRVWNTNMKPVGQPISLEAPAMGTLRPRVGAICMGQEETGHANTVLIGTRSGDILEVELPNESEGNSAKDMHIFRLIKSHYNGEVWGLAVHPHKKRYATCGDDKTIRLWDIEFRRQRACRTFSYPAKACAFSPDGKQLAVVLDASKDGAGGWIVIMDGAPASSGVESKQNTANGTVQNPQNWRVIKVIKGDARKSGTVIKYSPDGKLLAFGSHDRRIYLYNTLKNVYSKRAICKGHSSYITHLDFSIDSKNLQSNCGAYELLFWDVGGNQVTSATKMRDVQWSTWTCTLGWPVQGIWPKGADGTDVNAVSRSTAKDLLVTCDDFSRVKMFRYPCVNPESGFKTYDGHAAHVTNVSFAFGDAHVISTGGGDRCVFQWRCEYEEQEEIDVASADEDMHSDLENELGHDLTRTELQEAANGDAGADDLAELFQGARGGDEFMAVKPWLGTISVMKPTDAGKGAVQTEAAPDCDMELAWVHGYRSFDCRNNLRYTAKSHMVYPAAALGIVSNRREQRFFNLHTDDVISLAVHPQGKVIATGEIGRNPKIICWDNETLLALNILKGFHKRGVPLLAFSSGKGDKLVSVGLDNDFSIAVYAWAENHLVATCKSSKSKVLCVEFGSNPNEIITCGVNHVKFWTLKGSTLKCQKGLFGMMKSVVRQQLQDYGTINSKQHEPAKKRKGGAESNTLRLIQTALCIGRFKLPGIGSATARDMYVTGMMDGALYVWDWHKLEYVERAHIKSSAKSAVTAMYSHNDAFFTGDKQGKIKIWEPNACYDLEKSHDAWNKWKKAKDDRASWCTARFLSSPLICLFTIDMQVGPLSHAWMFNSYDITRPKGPHGDGPIMCETRSLCYKDGKLLIGTKCSSIFEADCTPPRPRTITDTKEEIDKMIEWFKSEVEKEKEEEDYDRLWEQHDDFAKRSKIAFEKYQMGGNPDLFEQNVDDPKRNRYKSNFSTPSPVTIVSQGHYTGELWGLDMHPDKNLAKFITCGDDGTARLWNLRSRECIRCVQLGIIEENVTKEANETAVVSVAAVLPASGKCEKVEDLGENGQYKITFTSVSAGNSVLTDYQRGEGETETEKTTQQKWKMTVKNEQVTVGEKKYKAVMTGLGIPAGTQIIAAQETNPEGGWEITVRTPEKTPGNFKRISIESKPYLVMRRDDASSTLGSKNVGKARACAFSPMPKEGNSSVLSSSDASVHVAFGIDDGSIEIWDGDLLKFVERINSKKFCAHAEGDEGVSQYKKGKHFPKEWIQDIKYSQSGNFLAVGSHDNNIYMYRRKPLREQTFEIYKQGRYELYCVCAKHNSFITHLDFSKIEGSGSMVCKAPAKDGTNDLTAAFGQDGQWYHEGDESRYLMSTCGAYELLFWDLSVSSLHKGSRPYKAKQVTRVSTLKDISWYTFTMPLGWNVQGIWPPAADGTDINAISRSNNERLCVTADDFGRVKLFRWPCISNKAQSKNYRGHASHVTNITFSHDDGYVISTGGTDNCIFLWKTDYDHNEQMKLESILNEKSERGDVSEEESESDSDENVVDPFAEMSGGDEFMAVKPWLGAIVAPSKWKASEDGTDADEPPKALALESIYGYNSDRRSNVFYSRNGDVVYFAAAAGVVHNPKAKEGKQQFNLSHTDDILAMAMHPGGNTVATGEIGRKPKIIVWDVNSTNTLLTITGFHRYGIELLAWSPSGAMLASVGRDGDHSIAIYDGTSGSMIANSKGHQNKVHALCFKSDAELVTAGVKHVKFWSLQQRKISGKNGLFRPKGKIQTVYAVCSMGANTVTGQNDGTLYLWQGRNCQDTRGAESSVHHEGPILTLSEVPVTMGDGVLSGGKDGKVILWDRTLTPLLKCDLSTLDNKTGPVPRGPLACAVHSVRADQGKILLGVKSAEIFQVPFDISEASDMSSSSISRVLQGHFLGETWGLATHPTLTEFVTVGDDATVRRWDLKHHQLLNLARLDTKARAIAYGMPSGAQIAVGTVSGSVVIYDSDLRKPLKRFPVSKQWIQDIKYSPNGKILGVSSHDNRIYLFDVKTYNQYAVLKGHSSYITHIDFSGAKESGSNCRWLQSNCGAYELLFWDTKTGKRTGNASKLRDVEWGTWTATLGWPAQGIWKEGQDGTDVNSVDRSPSKQLLVTGDDSGKVSLFRYPCVDKKAACRTSCGHSSHVTSVRFTCDEQYVVSTGGGDRCILQWKLQSARVQKRSSTKKAEKGGKKTRR